MAAAVLDGRLADHAGGGPLMRVLKVTVTPTVPALALPFPIGLLLVLRAWPATSLDAAYLEVTLSDRISRQPVTLLAVWNPQLLDRRTWDRVWPQTGWRVTAVVAAELDAPTSADDRPAFVRAAAFLEARRSEMAQRIAYPQLLTYDHAIDQLMGACAAATPAAGAVSGPDGAPA